MVEIRQERAGFSFLRKFSHGDTVTKLTAQGECAALNKHKMLPLPFPAVQPSIGHKLYEPQLPHL